MGKDPLRARNIPEHSKINSRFLLFNSKWNIPKLYNTLNGMLSSTLTTIMMVSKIPNDRQWHRRIVDSIWQLNMTESSQDLIGRLTMTTEKLRLSTTNWYLNTSKPLSLIWNRWVKTWLEPKKNWNRKLSENNLIGTTRVFQNLIHLLSN